jgi:hypothetical protein
MKKNLKELELVLNEISLSNFTRVPTFNQMLPSDVIVKLKVGSNHITVNHFIYSKLLNLQRPGNYKIFTK